MNVAEINSNDADSDLERELAALPTLDPIVSDADFAKLQWMVRRSFEQGEEIGPLPTEWDGNYRLLERIGSGMGEVYLAEQTNLSNKRVVIKILRHVSEKRLRLFAEESQVLGKLSALDSDRILVPIDQDNFRGTPYIVTEFIPGHNLNQVIRDKRFSLAESIDYVCQVARTMSDVHAKGVIHG